MRDKIARITIVIILLWTGGAWAAARSSLQFIKPIELPRVGLKCRIMPGTVETPPPTPALASYTFTGPGNATRKEELMSVADQWRCRQLIGAWRDEHSNELALFTVEAALPSDLPYPHASRDDFEKAYAKSRRTDWDLPALRRWLGNYLQAEPPPLAPVERKPFALQALAIADSGAPGSPIALFFCLNPEATGQSHAPTGCFAAIFHAVPTADRGRARTAIIQSFIPSLSGMRAITVPVGAPSAGKIQVANFAPGATGLHMDESRRLVIESIRNLKDWWYAATTNYIFLSNLKDKHGLTVRNMQANIEQLRPLYITVIPPINPIDAVSVVRIFGTEDEYVKYVGTNMMWSGGCWVPNRNELVLRPLTWGGARDRREWYNTILYHEGFHQYLFYALDRLTPAPWFNEGHAKLFDSAKVSRDRIVIEEDPALVAFLQQILVNDPVDIGRLTRLSYQEFYTANENAREYNYTMAWALIYFLRKGAPLGNDPRFQAIPANYLKALIATRDPEAATVKTFEAIPMADLRTAFIIFWKNMRLRNRAKYQPL